MFRSWKFCFAVVALCIGTILLPANSQPDKKEDDAPIPIGGKAKYLKDSLKRIQDLKKFYALDLDSSASHRLTEIKRGSEQKKTAAGKRK